MIPSELLDIADYIVEKTAIRASELLYHKLKGTNDWISQNEAYRRFGRAKVESLLIAGKVNTKPNGNRIEYNLSDLIENTISTQIIKSKQHGRN